MKFPFCEAAMLALHLSKHMCKNVQIRDSLRREKRKKKLE